MRQNVKAETYDLQPKSSGSGFVWSGRALHGHREIIFDIGSVRKEFVVAVHGINLSYRRTFDVGGDEAEDSHEKQVVSTRKHDIPEIWKVSRKVDVLRKEGRTQLNLKCKKTKCTDFKIWQVLFKNVKG